MSKLIGLARSNSSKICGFNGLISTSGMCISIVHLPYSAGTKAGEIELNTNYFMLPNYRLELN